MYRTLSVFCTCLAFWAPFYHLGSSLIFCHFVSVFRILWLLGERFARVCTRNLNFMMMVQSWIAILLEFSRSFRAGCCAKSVLHDFSGVFLMLATTMLRDLTLHVFFRVVLHMRQWQTEKFAFSSGFIDERAAATESVSIRILSMILAFGGLSLRLASLLEPGFGV